MPSARPTTKCDIRDERDHVKNAHFIPQPWVRSGPRGKAANASYVAQSPRVDQPACRSTLFPELPYGQPPICGLVWGWCPGR